MKVQDIMEPIESDHVPPFRFLESQNQWKESQKSLSGFMGGPPDNPRRRVSDSLPLDRPRLGLPRFFSPYCGVKVAQGLLRGVNESFWGGGFPY